MIEVTITGRLGGDPEIKYFESGKIKTNFSLATSGYHTNKKEKTTNWYSVDIWDKQAEFAGEYFKKGSSVTVQGYLKEEKYTNSKNEEKTNWKVVAQRASFDGAYLFITGEIEKVENRVTASDKKIQVLKLKDFNAPVYCFSENAIAVGEAVNLLCSFDMVDYKPVLKVVKSDAKPPQKEEKETHKPSDCLTQQEIEEIPFLGE